MINIKKNESVLACILVLPQYKRIRQFCLVFLCNTLSLTMHFVKTTKIGFYMTFLLSPSWMVAQFCVQQENACFHRGSPSGLHGNSEGPLRSGKSGVLPHIHSYHDCIHLQAFQKGRASPLLHLTVGMDPNDIVKKKVKKKSDCKDYMIVWYCKRHLSFENCAFFEFATLYTTSSHLKDHNGDNNSNANSSLKLLFKHLQVCLARSVPHTLLLRSVHVCMSLQNKYTGHFQHNQCMFTICANKDSGMAFMLQFNGSIKTNWPKDDM